MAKGRKRKVLLTCHPLITHIRPHQPWIKLFMRRGHDVVLATPDKMRAVVRQYRIPHFPAGVDWTTDRAAQRRLAGALINSGNERFCRILFGEYMPGLAPSMARDILRLAEQWRPDLIVHDCSEFGGYLAGEALGIPTLSSDNGLARLIYELHDGTIRPTLDRTRRVLGLGPEPRGVPGSFKNIATPVPKQFLLGDLRIPGLISYRHVNPQRPGEQLPAGVFDGEGPFIYVMLGSSGWAVPEMAPIFEHANRVAIEALSSYPCRALVSVGPGNVGKYNPGRNVRVVEYAAQPLALQHAQVFIGHAGFGSLREAMEAETPMVLMPHFADQPPNAERVVQTGLGVMLDTRRATPERLTMALEYLLARHRSYVRAVARMRRAMQSLRPLEDLVQQLERL
jgi:UDP:flavonoid glycosyltransferase YjiC (YdhE family)